MADSAALLGALDLPADVVPNGTPNGVPAVAKVPERMATIPAAKPYAYDMPVGKTALIMIDFQRDFFLPGGFGDALGNDIELLKVTPFFVFVLTCLCQPVACFDHLTQPNMCGNLPQRTPCQPQV